MSNYWAPAWGQARHGSGGWKPACEQNIVAIPGSSEFLGKERHNELKNQPTYNLTGGWWNEEK